MWERISQPQIKINGIILDEAHCLVQWGDTFRPAYRRLGMVRPSLLKSKYLEERKRRGSDSATAKGPLTK